MEGFSTSDPLPSEKYARLRVFFIGPRGAGKSASVNTIIGTDVAESTSSLRKESTTKRMNYYLAENQNVVLVDTPALRKSVIKELKREFTKTDVLAFVIAVQRLQMEDESCIITFLKDLKYLHPRSFILLTRGSNIEDDDNVLDPETSRKLYSLYEAVGKRYVVFENRNKTESERKIAVDKFLSMSREVGFNKENNMEIPVDNVSKFSKSIVIISNAVTALAVFSSFFFNAKDVLAAVATNGLYTICCCGFMLNSVYLDFQSVFTS